MTHEELVSFLAIHPHIEVVPAGVQGGLFGGDVPMVRLVVRKLGVLVSEPALEGALQELRKGGDVLPMIQRSLLAGAGWDPV